MSNGLLFVTAPEADYKAVNLLLHHLGNWGYGDGEHAFHLVTTKNAYNLELPEGTNSLNATSPSLDHTFDNSWAGSSLKDVEGFCLDMIHAGDQDDIAPSLFVVIDAAGFDDHSAILVEQAVDEEDEDFKSLDSFVKMRMPWEEVYIAWCGLSIANTDVDELGERKERTCDGGELDGGEGWYEYSCQGSNINEQMAKRKRKAFKRLQDNDRV